MVAEDIPAQMVSPLLRLVGMVQTVAEEALTSRAVLGLVVIRCWLAQDILAETAMLPQLLVIALLVVGQEQGQTVLTLALGWAETVGLVLLRQSQVPL